MPQIAMNQLSDPNPPGSSSLFTVRASSWGSLFDCAHKWEGEMLLGMRKPAGLRAHLGTSIHASTARFDSGRLPGGDRVSADDSADLFVQTLHNPDRDVDYSKDDLTVREAEKIGLKLHTRYCLDVSPHFNWLSVEAPLQPLDINCGSGIVIRLTGTMDRARVAATAAGAVIPDLKTGARVIANGAVVTKGRAPQLGTYQLMYEADRENGGATVGAQVIALQTTPAGNVGASPVFDARRVMVGTDDQPGLIEHAAVMFRTGLFPPNPQSTLCSPRYCGRWDSCPFHERSPSPPRQQQEHPAWLKRPSPSCASSNPPPGPSPT